MNKHEDFIANMEAARNEAHDAYFEARPQLFLTTEKQRIFEAGFEAAYKQQSETIERLKAALTNVKNCPESDLAAYVKSVDSIACETLAMLEAGGL